MVQTMLPKSLRAMKFYFTTVYQEIWVGVALTAYVYYKISYGGKKQWQISPLMLAIINGLFWEYEFGGLSSSL